MRILIVDDSVVFRSQIKAAFDGIPGIEVAGTAANGKIALDRLEQIPVDVVILDLEMPEMNGLQTIQEMQKRKMPQKVIVFASPTQSGALATFDALQAGASDFIPKPQGTKSLEDSLAQIRVDLVPKIIQFSKRSFSAVPTAEITKKVDSHSLAQHKPVETHWKHISISSFRPRAVFIGSSTGGPTALEAIFRQLKGRKLHVPIFVAQHMPPMFTESLAKRIEHISGHPCAEGKHGEIVAAGKIYIAPGDFHMTVHRIEHSSPVIIHLDQNPKRNSVRPAVDSLFESAARAYGAMCAAFILTGMGEDGMIGAKAIKDASGAVMIQNQETSVVWGMPGAVFAAGAYDEMGSLEDCGTALSVITA